MSLYHALNKVKQLQEEYARVTRDTASYGLVSQLLAFRAAQAGPSLAASGLGDLLAARSGPRSAIHGDLGLMAGHSILPAHVSLVR